MTIDEKINVFIKELRGEAETTAQEQASLGVEYEDAYIQVLERAVRERMRLNYILLQDVKDDD